MTTSTSKVTYRAAGHAAGGPVACPHAHRSGRAALRCAAASPLYDTVICNDGRAWEVTESCNGRPCLGRQLSGEEEV